MRRNGSQYRLRALKRPLPTRIEGQGGGTRQKAFHPLSDLISLRYKRICCFVCLSLGLCPSQVMSVNSRTRLLTHNSSNPKE